MAHTKHIGQQPRKIEKRKPREAPLAVTERTQWFDDLVAGIRTEQLKHDAGVASPEERSVLDLMMGNDQMGKAAAFSNMSERVVLDALVSEYVQGTDSIKHLLRKHRLLYDQKGTLTAWLLTDFDNIDTVGEVVYPLEIELYEKYSAYRMKLDVRLIDTEMQVAIPRAKRGIDLLALPANI